MSYKVHSLKWYARVSFYILAISFSYLVYLLSFPVVINFTVDNVVKDKEGILIEGKFLKVRNCKFELLAIHYEEDDLNYPVLFEFLDNKDEPYENQGARLEGKQYFGPWLIKVPEHVTNLNMRVLHKCSFGATRVTQLLTNWSWNEY